jgi:uncharacterized protein YjbI with pentapeptide repeats
MPGKCKTSGCDRKKWRNDECCIFHSKDIKGKKDSFKKEFRIEFERQKEDEKIEEYNFFCFLFPETISFENIIFKKSVNFKHAKFYGLAFFDGAEFSEKAYFTENIFFGIASFLGTQFHKFTTFEKSQFLKKADFGKAKFAEKSKFEEALFSGETNFSKVQFIKESSATFIETQFSKKADFSGAQFHGAIDFKRAQFLEYANFENIKIERHEDFKMEDTYFYDVSGLFEFITKNKKEFKKTKKTEFLPDNFKLILGERASVRYPMIGRKIKDDIYLLRFKEKHPNLHWWWWLLADCGRSFWKWAGWSLVLAFLFGIIYSPSPEWFSDGWKNLCEIIGPQFIYTPAKLSDQTPELLSLLYFSFVTFTTLGFGDIAAVNLIARILVTIEVIFGYIMLGGLISIMATKFARRS